MTRLSYNTALLIAAIQTINGAPFNITPDERVVALTLLGEARGEGYEGMYAVACVIKQRSIERKLSPSKVCLQRKQFSCWNGKTVSDLDKLFQSPSARHAVSLAKNIDNVDVESVGRANHYHNTRVNPYWSDKRKVTKRVGNHIFYRL